VEFLTVARRLPQSQKPADFVMMQQALVTGFDFQRPWLVGTEEVLFNAVQVGGTAAFEDEGLQNHSPKTIYQHLTKVH